MFFSGVKPFYNPFTFFPALLAAAPLPFLRLHSRPHRKCFSRTHARNRCHMPEHSPHFRATNKRAPISYPNNKGSIMRVWSAASFPTLPNSKGTRTSKVIFQWHLLHGDKTILFRRYWTSHARAVSCMRQKKSGPQAKGSSHKLGAHNLVRL